MWNSVCVLTIGILICLIILTPGPSLALHQSVVNWQLVVISSEPACSGYHHYMVQKYNEITEKYFELYGLENSQYKPECYTEIKFAEEYEKPFDLDLLILVYDRDKGRVELQSHNTGGLYIHQGNDLSTNHTVIICDCPNFKFSDPVWILSHELSHFILNYLGFDLDIVEKEIHGLDYKFDRCVEEIYDDLCSTVKTTIETRSSNWVVMMPYAPAIRKDPPPPLVQKISLESPIQSVMLMEITNWWLDGEISDENYVYSLNILSGKSRGNRIIPNGIFQDESLLILTEPQNNNNETLSADNSLVITKNFDDLNGSISGKSRDFSSEDEKIFREWLETKASSWRANKINDNEFIIEMEKVLDSSKVDLYIDYLNNLSAEELISKAVEFEKAGKFRNALSFYDRAILESFDSSENEIIALVGKGSVLNSLGQYVDAIVYFDNVLEIDPDNISALKKKAFALAQLGQIEKAREFFEIVAQIELK